jgi:hypothetical protein
VNSAGRFALPGSAVHQNDEKYSRCRESGGSQKIGEPATTVVSYRDFPGIVPPHKRLDVSFIVHQPQADEASACGYPLRSLSRLYSAN